MGERGDRPGWRTTFLQGYTSAFELFRGGLASGGPVIRAVLDALRDQISEGEVEEVIEQLPADWRDLWRPIVYLRK